MMMVVATGEITETFWGQQMRRKNRFSGRYDELIRIAPLSLSKPLMLKELFA